VVDCLNSLEATYMRMGTRFLLFTAGVAAAMAQVPAYEPLTAKGRVQWVVSNTTANLMAGAVTAGLATRSNSPEEYGSHWEGFAKRNALRMTGRATSSIIEASLGSLWGEDPRYFPASGQPLKKRLDNVFRMTFITHDRDGNQMPAYARYVAIPGSAFVTNAWRPDSQTQLRDALGRISISLMSRVIGNAFSEFGPDLRRRFFGKKDQSAAGRPPARP
jgi:hypothetical protein